MWGDSFINEYIRLFTTEYSFKNYDYARLSFHVILGQLLKNIYFRQGSRYIDIRTHLLLFQPSGTGKGAGFHFIVNICKQLGFQVSSFTESTSAGLVGTYDHFDERLNKWIMKEGELLSADIIAMEEASSLFDHQNKYNDMNLTYMQQAMNPLFDESCRIGKVLGGGKITKKPHASFLLMSYVPQNVYEILVSRGFLQRMTILWRAIGKEERFNVMDYAIEKMKHDNQKSWVQLWKEKKDKFENIITKFQVLKDYYGDEIREIRITNEALDVAGYYIKSLFNTIHTPVPIVKEKLEEFIHRTFELLLKYATHYAIIRLPPLSQFEVLPADVGKAFVNIIRPTWERTIYFIEDLMIVDERKIASYNKELSLCIYIYKTILQRYIENKKSIHDGYIPLREFIDEIQYQFKCTEVTARNKIKKFSTTEDNPRAGYFIIRKVGNVSYIKLNRDYSPLVKVG